MELPVELRNIIESELEKENIKQLQDNAEKISLKYRNEDNKKGKRLLTQNIEAVSYSAVRMPATYSAIYTALKNSFEICNLKINSLLDVGAGTGAGTWAANNLLELNKITCLEREDAMLNVGKKYMQQSDDTKLKNVEWKKFDIVNSEIKAEADLVICSYMLNEIEDKDREEALIKLWKSTNKMLLIVEPGTPIGFNEIKQIRETLINLGGKVVAPCPNIENCPMPENDWCHTTCRVARTKIHKALKNADVPYEDEKFSYVAVCKNIAGAEVNNLNYARVLRHPKIESGKITIKFCTINGISEKIITKKDKELFKIARKLKCGDSFKKCPY